MKLLTLADAMRGKQSGTCLLSCLRTAYEPIAASDTVGAVSNISNNSRDQEAAELGEAGAAGATGASRAAPDVLLAAQASNAHDFISEFSDGYATDVGEGSIMVSGGQKQRIGECVSASDCVRLNE